MSKLRRNDLVYAIAMFLGAALVANLLIFGIFFALKAWLHWTPPHS